jgi:hypothetical protein
MKHDAKVHVQTETTEKQQGHKPATQSKETATPDLANLTNTDLQHLTPAAVARLSELIGNRAVARLMAQRQEEEEEEIEGPRTQRQEDEEEEVVGPRMKQRREGAASRQGGSRVAGLASTIGDAFNVDGQGCYGWDRPMSATDVEDVVNDLLTTQSTFTENKRIVIFSGHHGAASGNLVGPVPSFYAEDQATATNAMSTYPGSQIEVIDDPSSYPTKAAMSPAFNSTAYIRILAWCYSKRSYNNQATLKANWWPEPDHINAHA